MTAPDVRAAALDTITTLRAFAQSIRHEDEDVSLRVLAVRVRLCDDAVLVAQVPALEQRLVAHAMTAVCVGRA